MREKKICSAEGCDKEIHARGYCQKHYLQARKKGELPRLYKKREMHGMRGTKIWNRWRDIRKRCRDSNSSVYRYYGGRGITVCKEWEESFMAFYTDMGDPPTDKHDIDRINNEGPYCKDNCRWVTRAENNQNRRSTKLTLEDARFIKTSKLSNKNLAKRFSVPKEHVWAIKAGRKWKNA